MIAITCGFFYISDTKGPAIHDYNRRLILQTGIQLMYLKKDKRKNLLSHHFFHSHLGSIKKELSSYYEEVFFASIRVYKEGTKYIFAWRLHEVITYLFDIIGVYQNKGLSVNDVNQFWKKFDSPPPSSRITHLITNVLALSSQNP